MSEQSVTSRRIPFWLVLSLMGNMLLIGLVAGMALRGSGKPQGPDWQGMQARHVTSEGRDAMRSFMRESYQATRAERDARAEERRHLAEALLTEPYDEAAVREAFARLRASEGAVQVATHEVMIRKLKTLTPEQRAAMVAFLSRGPAGHRSRFRPPEE